MTSLAINAAKGQIKDSVGNMKQNIGGNKIDFNEFNYPPLVKVIHYRITDLDQQPELKKIAKFLFITHIGVFIWTLFNFISNCIQAGTVDQSGQGMRIFLSIIWLIIINPLHLAWAYFGYRGLVDSDSWLSQFGRFKLLGFILILVYIVASILGGPMFNGWVRLANLFSNEFPGAGVLALIEILFIYAIIVLMVLCMWKVQNRP
ncbi:hypothetical protein PPERSA_07519 [Pseudocohnilembus persalinus]|uniref:Uncharacterized protein n=1 Tax=Pseudocohnilembus persalinus TaxID=266149 RepID=A0A0V0QZQ9_PSEPJ|nr:hypothetical protein PPERSA_07519 [Pseudocohnilembus persalinus]|eukprot:KRX07769.1 hypothetical protein PPERSA_07519 [Pseudocohnilembus persalinus]